MADEMPVSESPPSVGLQLLADGMGERMTLENNPGRKPMNRSHILVPVVRRSFLHVGDEGRAKWKAPDGPIAALCADAVRRLPVDDMPELVQCLFLGGHCIGLLDPVSNIILNALNLLCRLRCGRYSPAPSSHPASLQPRLEGTWAITAVTSYRGLVAFMQAYFRYLTEEQAQHYIHLSGGDLVVAIRIAELEQSAAVRVGDGPIIGCHSDLFRDRAQFALRIAAATAEHPMPDDVAMLCHPALYESTDIKAVLATLEEKEEKGSSLTVSDVDAILSVLKSHHRKVNAKGGSASFFRPRAVFNLTNLRSRGGILRRLESSLSHVPQYNLRSRGGIPQKPTRQYVNHLKMCLSDIIHAFYIEALTKLPSGAHQRLLRGILVAGHCYGAMDPVSNIILHAVWYTIVAPPEHTRSRSEPDILGTDAMLRLEVCSLDGLIAVVRSVTGISEDEAVEHLCATRCDLRVLLSAASHSLQPGILDTAFGRASEAAKHPLRRHHLPFLKFLLSNEEELHILTSSPCTVVLSDDTIAKLHIKLEGAFTKLNLGNGPFCLCATHIDWILERQQELMEKQFFLRTELCKLLDDYADQNPWEPLYKLDIICGVEENSDDICSHCYHVNFRAVQCDGRSSAASMLFFAQVWETKSQENSFCCPLPHYNSDNPYLGRCSMCEPYMCKIVHPPSGVHIEPVCTQPRNAAWFLHLCAPGFEELPLPDDITWSELAYCTNSVDHYLSFSTLPEGISTLPEGSEELL